MTLVEVMISTVLASLVVAGGFMIMASQRPVITGQMKIAKRQQDLWVAMEFIQRDFRKAGMGFGHCATNQGGNTYRAHANVWPAPAASPQVVRPIVITDGGTTGTDTITITWFEPLNVGAGNAALAGSATWKADGTTTTIDVVPVGSGATGPEGAQGFMEFGKPCGTALAQTPTLAIIYSLQTTPPPAERECWIFQVSNATCAAAPTPSQLVTMAKPPLGGAAGSILGAVDPPYTPRPPAIYTGNAYQIANLGQQRVVRYAISTASGIPQLERTVNGGTPDVVAVGIEDLQVAAGCDVNANGQIDLEPATDTARATDEWFYNVAGDTVPATCTAFPQVRVSLVSRTLEPDGAWTVGVRPNLENHAAATANDQFHRRVLSQVISAQNANL
jgi:hypothetical protein